MYLYAFTVIIVISCRSCCFKYSLTWIARVILLFVDTTHTFVFFSLSHTHTWYEDKRLVSSIGSLNVAVKVFTVDRGTHTLDTADKMMFKRTHTHTPIDCVVSVKVCQVEWTYDSTCHLPLRLTQSLTCPLLPRESCELAITLTRRHRHTASSMFIDTFGHLCLRWPRSLTSLSSPSGINSVA